MSRQSLVQRIDALEAQAQIALAEGQLAQAAAIASGNWVSITATAGAAQDVPHSQSALAAHGVAALCLVAKVSGIFMVGIRASFSDDTNAQLVTHQLVTKQAAAPGVLAGGLLEGVLGSGASGGSGIVNNVDGSSLTFNGGSVVAGTTQQGSEQVGTLTGLLTPNGTGCQNFGFSGIVNANGITSNVKLPFTKGNAVLFSLLLASGGVVTYDSLQFWAIEMPVG